MASLLPVTGKQFNRSIKTVLVAFLLLTTLSVIVVAGRISLKAPEVLPPAVGGVTDITPEILQESIFERPFLLTVLRNDGSFSFAQIENGVVFGERLVNEVELTYQNGDSGLVAENNGNVDIFISKKGAKETVALIVRGVTGITLQDETTLPVKLVAGRVSRGKLVGDFELQTLTTNKRILGKFDTRGKLVNVKVENAIKEPDATSSLIAKEVLKLQISMEGKPDERVLAATTDRPFQAPPTVPLNRMGQVASFFQIRQNHPDGSLTIETAPVPGLPATGVTVATGPQGPPGPAGLTGGAPTGDATLSTLLTTSGTTGSTSSNSGLEVSSSGIALLKGCTDNEILKWTDAGGWACSADSTGGTPAFNSITSGTNTTATMTVGAGSSLTYSGGTATSGVINANQLLGGTWAIPGTIGSTTPNTGAFTTLSSTGVTTLGNNSATVAINSSAWDISTVGDMTNIGSISLDGPISFSGAGTITSNTTNALTLDSGTTGTVNLGTGNNAKTINIGTGTAGDAINVGTNNTTADTISIGSALDSLTLSSANWSVTSAGLGTFSNIIDTGLAINSAVYTNGSSQLTTTAPTSGTLGYWSRTGTTLSPATAGDAVTTSGNISSTGTGTITSAGLLTASNGLTVSAGALNMTSTSGALTISGLGTSSISTTGSGLTFSTVTSGTLALTSAGALNMSAGAASAFTLANVANALNFDSNTLSIDALNNRIGIGLSAPSFQTSILGTQSASSIANIVNLNTTSSTSLNALRLGIGTTTGSLSRFVTFFSDVTTETDGQGVGNIHLNNNGVTYQSGNADIAELMSVPDSESVSPGHIVAAASSGNVKATTTNNVMIGVVSDTAAFMGNANALTEGGANTQVVGIAGFVDTFMTGDVAIGDPITVSSTAGVGQKATSAGYIIGKAAEAHSTGDGTTRVLVSVMPGWYDPSVLATATDVNFGDTTATKTIDIGGVTNSATDTINIVTNGTASDAITVGNSNAATTVTITGGDDWSMTGAGALTLASFTRGSDTITDFTGNGIEISSGSLQLATTTGGAGLTYTSGVLAVGAGNGITVNANDVTVDLTAATDALSSTTSSGSGLEVLATGLTLLQGCTTGQILKWNETTDVWECSADSTGGSPTFDSIASGTNTTATMVVDTGASLNFANSGTINASSLGSATFAAPGAIGGGTAASGTFTTLTSTGLTNLGTTGASNVNIATTGTGNTTIGNATGTFALTSSGGLNVTTVGALSGVSSIDTIGVSATALTFAGAGSVLSTTTSALTLDSGTTGNVNLGSGANAKAITIGSSTSGTTLSLTGGATWSLATTGTSSGLSISGASNTLSNIGNASLTNSSVTVTAGTGLADGGSVSLGGTTTLNIGAGSGITVNANDVTIDLTVATDALSEGTTSSGSGLEVLATGLTLLQGCTNGQILQWNETTDVWACATNAASVTWDSIGDPTLGADIAFAETAQTIDWNTNGVTALAFDGMTYSITNDALTDILTQRLLVVENRNDGGSTGISETLLAIDNQEANEILTNGLLIEQSAGGTMTNAIQILETAGTITDGILVSGTLSNILNTDTLDITGAGAITGATGVTLSSGNVSIAASQSYTGAGAVTLSSGTATALTIDSGTTGAINLGTDASAESINLGTGVAAKTLVLGSTNTTSTTTLQSGSGNINLQASGTSTGNVQVGTGAGTSTPDLLVLDNKNTAGDPTGVTGGMYYNSNLNKFRCYQNGAWTNCVEGDKVTALKSTDESCESDAGQCSGVSTTLQNDDDLSFSVLSGETWIFQFRLVVTNNNDAGPDWKSAILAPTGSTCSVQLSGDESVGADFPQIQATDCTTPATLVNNGIVQDANNGFNVNLQGRVTAGADGTVNLQWSQNTADTTALTVEQGSLLRAYKVGGADLAEVYYGDTSYEEGTVVSVNSAINNGVKESSVSYDRTVVGVVSAKPGLVIGDAGNGATNLVALSGRVPVKVNTENGEIKAGDYLTTSSTPGVAMKATKSGAIIGTALTDFGGEGTGEVIVFVKNGVSNGSKLAEVMKGIDIDNRSDVLTNLIQEKDQILTASADMSEIMTDRVVAGMEIITPKVITQDILATGMFVMQDKEGNENVKISSNGNAIFMGTIKADKIEANEIKGFKLLTDSISTLSDKVAGLATESGGVRSLDSQDSLGMTDGNNEMNVTDLINNIFRRVAEFFDKVIFHGDVFFAGRPTFNKDTAGFAIIKSGANEVEVKFEKEYATEPVVNISLNIAGDINISDIGSYAIADVNTKGFKIRLSKVTGMDLRFSWMAIAVKDAKSVEGNTTIVTAPVTTPTVSPIPTQEVTPTVTPEPTPTQSEEVAPITPEATPTPEVTPGITPSPEATDSGALE